MSELVAAFPMYDWPEMLNQTDAEWAQLRDLLRGQGIAAPQRMARCNADLPPVPGGIRDAAGRLIAPDPATLPPDELDLHALWRHPDLLIAQTCWGPMELGVGEHVQVVGQPDYSAFEGGKGGFYSSAILMRRSQQMPSPDTPRSFAPASVSLASGVRSPDKGGASIPLRLLAGKRFAYNSTDSMSGILALGRDLEAMGAGLEIFSELLETGAHRASARAVAEGGADVCAIDCRTWHLIRRHQPDTAAALATVGWTGLRKGLPFISASGVPANVVVALRDALARAGMLAA